MEKVFDSNKGIIILYIIIAIMTIIWVNRMERLNTNSNIAEETFVETRNA